MSFDTAALPAPTSSMPPEITSACCTTSRCTELSFSACTASGGLPRAERVCTAVDCAAILSTSVEPTGGEGGEEEEEEAFGACCSNSFMACFVTDEFFCVEELGESFFEDQECAEACGTFANIEEEEEEACCFDEFCEDMPPTLCSIEQGQPQRGMSCGNVQCGN